MKPIFTIGIPSLSLSDLEKLSIKMSNKLTEYNVLVYTTKCEEVKFELFNADKLQPVDLEEIRSILSNL